MDGPESPRNALDRLHFAHALDRADLSLDETRDEISLGLDERDHLGTDSDRRGRERRFVLDSAVDSEEGRIRPGDAKDEGLAADIHFEIVVGEASTEDLGTGPLPGPDARDDGFDVHGSIFARATRCHRGPGFVYVLAMKVALTGSTGLVGTALSSALAGAGHELVRLVRRASTRPGEAQWDIAAGTIDAHALEDVDAIVHLAGENIGQRWSESVRRRVLESRVEGTRLIAETAAGLPAKPVLVCASATGYYGSRGAEELDEGSPRGDGFLAEVVEQWEAAAEPARTAGLRVAHLRQGLILAKHGGALQRMLLPFKLGIGGNLGSGKQWWSWVSLDDAIAAYLFALEHPLEGPVNVTAPQTGTNADFTRALGRALHRPTIVPAPAFAIRLAFGEMGETMLLEGQHVVPAKLLRSGFAFGYPDLDSALARALSDSA